MAEPVIVDAHVAPGHDGEAILVVRVEHENGVVDSVTLDARAADKLLADCQAETTEGLCGQPWRRLLSVLEDAGREPAPGPARETSRETSRESG